jgi:hypothetical protein
MPALAGLVSATIDQANKAIGQRGHRRYGVTVVLGDGSSTYPSGGIPCTVGSKTVAQTFGMPKKLLTLEMIGGVNGVPIMSAAFDYQTQTIRLVHPTQQTGGTGNRDGVEYSTSDVPPATTLYAIADGY